MIRRLRRELDISHFGESFDADEANIDSPDRIKLAIVSSFHSVNI